MTEQAKEMRDACLNVLDRYARLHQLTEQLTSYIEEAENQEGEEYWQFFQYATDALEDFELYLSHTTSGM